MQVAIAKRKSTKLERLVLRYNLDSQRQDAPPNHWPPKGYFWLRVARARLEPIALLQREDLGLISPQWPRLRAPYLNWLDAHTARFEQKRLWRCWGAKSGLAESSVALDPTCPIGQWRRPGSRLARIAPSQTRS